VYLSLQSQPADGLAISAGLLRSRGTGQLDLLDSVSSITRNDPMRGGGNRFSRPGGGGGGGGIRCENKNKPVAYVVNTKVVQCLGDLNLLGGVEESVGELLSLSQGAFDDLERVDIAEKVGDRLIGIPAVERCGLDRLVVRLVACSKRGRGIRIRRPWKFCDKGGLVFRTVRATVLSGRRHDDYCLYCDIGTRA